MDTYLANLAKLGASAAYLTLTQDIGYGWTNKKVGFTWRSVSDKGVAKISAALVGFASRPD